MELVPNQMWCHFGRNDEEREELLFVDRVIWMWSVGCYIAIYYFLVTNKLIISFLIFNFLVFFSLLTNVTNIVRVYIIEHFPFSAHGLFFLSGACMSGSFFSFSSTYSRILQRRKEKENLVTNYNSQLWKILIIIAQCCRDFVCVSLVCIHLHNINDRIGERRNYTKHSSYLCHCEYDICANMNFSCSLSDVHLLRRRSQRQLKVKWMESLTNCIVSSGDGKTLHFVCIVCLSVHFQSVLDWHTACSISIVYAIHTAIQ